MNNILTVTQLNTLIKDIFEVSNAFKNIKIKGEVSNFKGKNYSGHFYFKIKDDTSVISCVIFKYDSFSCDTNIKDGDVIVATGNLSCYVPSGSYQLIIKQIEKEGEGDILLQKKKLIEKLNKEGLFDESRKKPLPKFPHKIGLIVGKNSAAAKDLEFNLSRRWPLIEINFFYSLVQGKDASKDLINNIQIADKSNMDLLIISRGGGSIEDLSAFDDENLVRLLSTLKTPFISAVGHEINKSITDLIADKYASTPSSASELAVPSKDEILYDLSQTKDLIDSKIKNKIISLENNLNKIKSNNAFKNINLLYSNFEHKISVNSKEINTLYKNYLIKIENKLNYLKVNVNNLNPKNILSKGYTIIEDENSNIIGRSNKLEEKETKSKIIFYDKEVNVIIKKDE